MRALSSSALTRRALIAAAAAASTLIPPHAARAVEAKSPLIAATSNLLPSPTAAQESDPVMDSIAWDAPKRRGLSTEEMAGALDAGLRERAWFVTGRGLPQLFSDRFSFSDPDVSLDGYEMYCRQVRRLFDQQTASCEVVCCAATSANTITVLWRNAGRVNLGPVGFELRPYVVTTTLRTDPTDGLVVSQEDAFKSDGPQLLLYQQPAMRPFLDPPAPSVEELRKRCDLRTCKLA